MRTTPMFVTANDYYNATGQNLSQVFEDYDNPSQAANLFLLRIENEMMARIDQISFRVTRWEDLSQLQKDNFQLAIVYEAQYIIRNGDIFSDSGYDLEKGIVATPDQLRAIEICRPSMDLLLQCGLLNRIVKNRRRYTNFC